MKRILIALMAAALVAALSVPAYAAGFTPSAEAKAEPEIVTQDGAAAVITDARGNIIKNLAKGEVVITSVANKNAAPSAAIKEQLADAQTQIKEADKLDDLTGQLRNALSAAKQQTSSSSIKNAQLEDLAISNLFDVAYVVDGAVTPIPSNGRITFILKTDLTKDDLFFVLHNIKDDVWEVVPEEDTELYDNGDLAVTVDSLSPFAIVVDRRAYAAGGTTPTAGGDTTPVSPKTGETVNYTYLAGTVAMLVCAAFLCVKGTKRREA